MPSKYFSHPLFFLRLCLRWTNRRSIRLLRFVSMSIVCDYASFGVCVWYVVIQYCPEHMHMCPTHVLLYSHAVCYTGRNVVWAHLHTLLGIMYQSGRAAFSSVYCVYRHVLLHNLCSNCTCTYTAYVTRNTRMRVSNACPMRVPCESPACVCKVAAGRYSM